MPTQTTDIFNPATPGIEYAGPGITWKIEDVSVGSGTSVGVYSNHVNSTLINRGIVYSSSNAAAFFSQDNTKIHNKKTGQINGELGLHVGSTTVTNVEVHNDGYILGYTLIGLYASDISDFRLFNAGDIFGASTGLVIYTVNALPKASKIENTGRIHSDNTGILSQIPANLRTQIFNREDGVIEGDTNAIIAASGMLKLKNEGKIKGDIALLAPDASDTVTNKGTIKGDTNLGSGDDIFKNKDGKAKMLFGGDGNDKFVAGSTRDQIVFDTPLHGITNVDTIRGFAPGKDQFYLDMSIFGALTGPGPLLASEFRKGNAAVDGNDYVVYHKGSGALFYDPDGSGATPQTKFAEVDPGTKLSHNDFTVIA